MTVATWTGGSTLSTSTMRTPPEIGCGGGSISGPSSGGGPSSTGGVPGSVGGVPGSAGPPSEIVVSGTGFPTSGSISASPVPPCASLKKSTVSEGSVVSLGRIPFLPLLRGGVLHAAMSDSVTERAMARTTCAFYARRRADTSATNGRMASASAALLTKGTTVLRYQ